jgi:hypothetical protein
MREMPHRSSKHGTPITGSRAGAQVSRGASPAVGSMQLLRLQRAVGNRAVAATMSSVAVQRCGPVPCDCPADEREAAEEHHHAAPVQRVNADFEVKNKSSQAAGDPSSIFFNLNSSTIDLAESAKLSVLAGVPLSAMTLNGLVSEEESGPSALADARLAAVEARLKAISPGTGSVTKNRDLTSGVGQLDYRGVRRVEILISGATTSVPNCSAGADISCGPSPNAFDNGFDAATTTLLPEAIKALDKPRDSPAKEALALFGGVGKASKVKAKLKKIESHFTHMSPAIPLNDPTAAGHRCINTCEGDVVAYNQGVGAAARMTVGPVYLGMADPIRQGLMLIHEASHGTPGLTTDDKAYQWQRLLGFLPPNVALQNADSFTRFVELIHDPVSPAKGVTDTATALGASKRKGALEAMAWLEQWLVQGRLEVRSLYGAAHRTITKGSWDTNDRWYRDNVMAHIAKRFSLTAPPAIPKADDKAAIAGIFDRLFQLRVALTSGGRTLEPGPSPSIWEPGPGAKVTLSPEFLKLGKHDKVVRLLVMIVDAAPFVESARKSAYVDLVKDMSGDFGGP